jgi:sugar porter (SP) family MFS transporter
MATNKGVTIGGQHFAPLTWYKERSLIKLYALCVVLILTSVTTGFDATMMNGLQALSYWKNYFKQPNASTLGLLNCIPSVGGIIAALGVPFFADNIGRKFTLVVGLGITSLGIALQTASVNTGMFIGGRFLIGFGSSTASLVAPFLIADICHPQHRAVMTTLYNTFFYVVGSIIAAWATYGALTIQSDWAWRAPSLLQAWSTVLQISLIWFVPESPRYLINRNRESQAREILTKYHAPASGAELVEAEFDEICTTSELERASSKNKWSDIWSTKGNRHRVLVVVGLGLFSQLSGNALVSFYMTKILDSICITGEKEQLEINGGLNIYNWVVSLVSSLCVEKIGRRPLFLASSILMLSFFTAWTICAERYTMTGSNAASTGVLVFIFLLYTAYNMAFNGALICYVIEVLPYQIRAKCFSIFTICLYVAGFFGAYVNPIGIVNSGWKYYLLYICLLAMEVIFVFLFIVETKNTSLEEVAVLFEGDNALVGGGVVPTKVEIELHNEKEATTAQQVEVAEA